MAAGGSLRTGDITAATFLHRSRAVDAGSPWRIVTFRELNRCCRFLGRQTGLVLFSEHQDARVTASPLPPEGAGAVPDVLVSAVMRSRSLEVTDAAIMVGCGRRRDGAAIAATRFFGPAWLDVLFRVHDAHRRDPPGTHAQHPSCTQPRHDERGYRAARDRVVSPRHRAGAVAAGWRESPIASTTRRRAVAADVAR
jgi:hypothetical protein